MTKSKATPKLKLPSERLWKALLALDNYDSTLSDPRIARAYDLICVVWAEHRKRGS